MAPRRVNLLPPELIQRRVARQRTSMLIIGAGALIVALVAVFGLQTLRLAAARGDLEAQQERNADLRAQKAELADFDQLEAELNRKSRLIADLTAAEVRWSVLLADISLVIPQEAWLTSFTGNVNETAATARTPRPGDVIGTIQMNGVTFTHLDVARWLTRLGEVDAFAMPYLTLSSRSEIGQQPVVTFNSSVQLAPEALRRNQPGAVRRV